MSPQRSFLFPVLLRLCTKGEGFGSSLARCRTETVKCPNCCGCRAVVGLGRVGDAPRALPEGAVWLGNKVAARTAGGWGWGCPEPQGSCGTGSIPLWPGEMQVCASLGVGPPLECGSGRKGVLHPGGQSVLQLAWGSQEPAANARAGNGAFPL